MLDYISLFTASLEPLHSYVLNNPHRFIEPTGLSPSWASSFGPDPASIKAPSVGFAITLNRGEFRFGGGKSSAIKNLTFRTGLSDIIEQTDVSQTRTNASEYTTYTLDAIKHLADQYKAQNGAWIQLFMDQNSLFTKEIMLHSLKLYADVMKHRSELHAQAVTQLTENYGAFYKFDSNDNSVGYDGAFIVPKSGLLRDSSFVIRNYDPF